MLKILHVSVYRVAVLISLASASAYSALGHAADFNGLDINLLGVATLPSSGANAGKLLLTPAVEGSVGAAWLNTPLSTHSALTTTFSFDLSNPATSGFGMADGLALVFHAAGSSALGTGGGALGIDLPGGSVAAVLQTFWGTYGVVQHSDVTGGPFTNSLPVLNPIELNAMTRISGTETVTYDPVSHQIAQAIQLSYTDSSSNAGSFSRNASAAFDLSALFGPTMTVGLSAATGAGFSDQTITAWSMAPVPEPETYAMLLAGLGLMGSIARRQKG